MFVPVHTLIHLYVYDNIEIARILLNRSSKQNPVESFIILVSLSVYSWLRVYYSVCDHSYFNSSVCL